MIFTELNIKGAFEVTLERRGDARGFFARTYCTQEFENHGLNTFWAQMNVSYSQTRGTLRGMHFQRVPALEVKMVRCISGRVLDVFVDIRRGSKTFGQHCAVTLDADHKNAVYIPAGCAHGFQTLNDDVELEYCHSHPYAPKFEGGINPQDPMLGIKWPLPVSVISTRDTALPQLSDCDPS